MATKRGKRLIKSDGRRQGIKRDLEELAPLDQFWVSHGLVHFLDSSGNPYVVADDDDAHNEASIAYLEQIGTPVFSEESEMNTHIENLRRGI